MHSLHCIFQPRTTNIIQSRGNILTIYGNKPLIRNPDLSDVPRCD